MDVGELGLFQRKPDAEAGVAGLGPQLDGPVVLANDAHNGIEAEAGPFANLFGGEKGVEDAGLNFGGNAGTIIFNFDDGIVEFARRVDSEFAFAIHGVDGIVNEVGPDLIEFATIATDARQVGSVFADNGDAGFQAVAKNFQRVFEIFVEIDFLHGGLVHVRVALDGGDKIGDAASGVIDFLDETKNGDDGSDAFQGGSKDWSAGGGDQSFKFFRSYFGFGEHGRNIPRLFDIVLLEPCGECIFAIAPLQRVERRAGAGGGIFGSIAFELENGVALRVGNGLLEKFDAGRADIIHGARETLGGATSGSGGIIEFVGEAGGKFAESGEFFLLGLHASNLANAIGHEGDEALSQQRTALQHVWKILFVEQ